MSVVIAVAAPPGAGKTALVGALAARLSGAVALAHDAYEDFTDRSAEEIAAWIDRGAPYDEIDLSDLAADLARLRAGAAIVDRVTGRPIRSAGPIVVETPFGRAHPALRPLIDFQVWIEVPADLALARRLSQFVGEAGAAKPAELPDFIRWLDGYLEQYRAIVRPAVAIQRGRVVPDCDLVLDDPERGVDEQAAIVLQALAAAGCLDVVPREVAE